MRIARDIRHAVNGWRHGAEVDAFAAERSEVLAAWDDLRARVRDEGDAVALSPAFRETLDRHGALMKQAETFRAKPQVFERLLVERASMGHGELDELGQVYARAGSYRRSASGKAAHARRLEPERPEEPQRTQASVEATARPQERSQVAEEASRAERPAETPARPPKRPAAAEPARSEAPGPDLSQAAWRRLRHDWRMHLLRAARQGEHRFELDGAGPLVERMAALAGSEGLAAEPRARLEEIVGEYRAHAAARDRVRVLLRDGDRHWLRYRTISHRARDLGVPLQEQRSWLIWLDRNERLLRQGRAILDDPAAYRARLDRIGDGRERLRDAVSRMERFSSAYRTQSRSRDRGRSWSM